MSETAAIARAEDNIDDGMLQAMRAAAVFQARRIGRTLKLSAEEREDVEQEILLVLLERRRFFDPERGPWVPFAHKIARQAAQSVADSLAAARRHTVPMGQTSTTSADGEADSMDIAGSIVDDRTPTEAGILAAISVVASVSALPHELRLVAEVALEADGELAEAQRATGLSTSEFYRRMREIRYRMVMIGLVDRSALRPLGKKLPARGYLQSNEASEGADDLLGKTALSIAT
jgi:DNA-directed RNA polymerase specialized sigma24 family protein